MLRLILVNFIHPVLILIDGRWKMAVKKGLSSELERFYEPFRYEIPAEVHKQIVGSDEFIRMMLIVLLSGMGHSEADTETSVQEESMKGFITGSDIFERSIEETNIAELNALAKNVYVAGAKEAHGHLLVESGVGGGKTEIPKTVFGTISGATTNRIQFHPDLKPSSIQEVTVRIGGEWISVDGPIVANFNILDEITRVGPSLHTALIQPMSEGNIDIPGRPTRRLPRPSMMVATANPFDVIGVSPLGWAINDRFAFRIDGPEYTAEQEIEIYANLERRARERVGQPVSAKEVLMARDYIHEDIVVHPDILVFVQKLLSKARKDPELFDPSDITKHGPVGLRPGIWMVRTAKARAFWVGRMHVELEDICALAYYVLRHRIDLGRAVRAQKVLKKLKVESLIRETLYETERVGSALSGA